MGRDVHRAEGDIVSPSRGHRRGTVIVASRWPRRSPRGQRRRGSREVAVVATDMDTCGLDPRGKARVVVDDQGTLALRQQSASAAACDKRNLARRACCGTAAAPPPASSKGATASRRAAGVGPVGRHQVEALQFRSCVRSPRSRARRSGMPAPCRAKRRPRALRQVAAGDAHRIDHLPVHGRQAGQHRRRERRQACRGGATARGAPGANDAGGAHQVSTVAAGAVATIDDQHMRRAALQQMAPASISEGSASSSSLPTVTSLTALGRPPRSPWSAAAAARDWLRADPRRHRHRRPPAPSSARRSAAGRSRQRFRRSRRGYRDSQGCRTRIADTGMSSRIACACLITQSVRAGARARCCGCRPIRSR